MDSHANDTTNIRFQYRCSIIRLFHLTTLLSKCSVLGLIYSLSSMTKEVVSSRDALEVCNRYTSWTYLD
jgi:hypothetical protein